MEEVKGKYKKCIYESEKGYVIGVMKLLDTKVEDLYDFIGEDLTFTGYFPELKLEEDYYFYGEVVDHPKYGLQFQVSKSKLILPEDRDGLILFLSSDLFKGVGEKQAKKIVDTLGKDAIDKILEDKNTLYLVPKLSEKKINQIYETLKEYASSHTTIIELTNLGFTMRDATSIYYQYKENTKNIIKENPYQLIEDIKEITFLKIEKIKDALHIANEDERRMKACICYVMSDLCFKYGDTYLNYEEIKEEVDKYIKKDITSYMDELILEGKIIKEDENYYLTELYEAEDVIASAVSYLSQKEKRKLKKIKQEIKQLEKEDEITYNEEQKEAIISALENHITIITGGPGTGKTTIMKAIVKLYEKLEGETPTLLAPTGRASKRMMELSLRKSTTIHRFLKWDKDSNSFMVNEYNKDFSKFIIVDEVSMLDVRLLSSLFLGLTSNIQLVLVGDEHQLPSVQEGNVLKDLIDSKKIKTIYLNTLYRQSKDSYIPYLAEEVKENKLSEEYKKVCDDYIFLPRKSEDIIPTLEDVTRKVKEKYDISNIIVLSPMYKGVNGIDHYNQILQNIFNPKKDQVEIKVGDVIYREKDKILQLKNDPDNNIFNGDIGFIEKIIKEEKSDSKKHEVYINFDGNIVKYLPKDFVNIKHGFSISIHKSQGSEFDVVILTTSMSYFRMLYRKLIYTAITRAKKKLIIIGEPQSFLYAIENNNERKRKTSLKEKIITYET